MPAHCAQDFAFDIATFSQGAAESVTEYTTRYRHLLQRYADAVKRSTGKTDVWQAFSVCMYSNGLKPEVKMTASTQKPPSTIEEAAERARNIEAGMHSTHTTSSVSFAASTNFQPKRKPKRFDNKKRKLPSPPPAPSAPITCRYRGCRAPTTHVIRDCLDRLSV